MPTVMIAAALLLALKAIELSTQSSYLFSTPAAAAGGGHDAAKPDPKSVRPTERPPVDRRGELAIDPSAEGALDEALGKRREAIDARLADVDAREALLKAAEKRLEDRLGELKRIEASIAEADKRKAEQEDGKIKELVVMYENMKPKEAARIFEKLDPSVLLDVASRVKPRQLSLILGLMPPDAAQKLTVSLARRQVAPEVAEAMATELPKIEGKLPPR